MKTRQNRLLVIAGLLPLVVAGCRANKHPELRRVAGQVVYQDQPVADATVAFYHKDSARPATGTTAADGSFYLTSFEDNDGALPGEHTVVVTKTVAPADDTQFSMDDAVTAPRARGKTQSLLPPGYASVKTSPLRVTVTDAGPNDFKIELEDGR